MRDEQRKRELGYKDKRSKVWPDGREKLYGADWKKRKVELHLRSGGRCERRSILDKHHVSRCSGLGEEPHHIIKRSKQRDDRLSNLANLSHWCHAAES